MCWLNQLFVKGGAWKCPPKILIPSKIYIFFWGGPLSPPARKKCVPAARNPSLWMIKGPIIYLPIFFSFKVVLGIFQFFSPPSKKLKNIYFFGAPPEPPCMKKMCPCSQKPSFMDDKRSHYLFTQFFPFKGVLGKFQYFSPPSKKLKNIYFFGGPP